MMELHSFKKLSKRIHVVSSLRTCQQKKKLSITSTPVDSSSPSLHSNNIHHHSNNTIQQFNAVPREFWDIPSNHRLYLDGLAKKLGYTQMDDWYKATADEIHRHGGKSFLFRHYNSSLWKALRMVYTDYMWLPWKFSVTAQGFWKKKSNHKIFFDWLGKTLGFKELDDWYGITSSDIHENGGMSLLITHYSGSPSKALEAIYPEHNWMPWRFPKPGKHSRITLTKDRNQQRKLLDWIGEKLYVKRLDDWYRISLHQVHRIAGRTMFKNGAAVSQMLVSVYPEHQWDMERLTRTSVASPSKASQRYVAGALHVLFPKHDIHEDYKHPKLEFVSGRQMELDIFIPQLTLAIEYQGEQHYKNVYALGEQRQLAERDQEKRDACKKVGITLVEVPYWWDGTKESLAATIVKARPEIQVECPEDAQPIPPQNTQPDKTNKIVPLSHGFTWDGRKDLTDWWLSEKLDGVRGYWNGRQLISRHGKPLHAPRFFTEGLPSDTPLDGELWMGHETFEKIMGVLKSADEENWQGVGYYVFDLPASRESYEERMKRLEELKLPSHVHVLTSVKCKGQQHLEERLESVHQAGGEGLMAREPKSLYVSNVTPTLLKVKKFDDTEVLLLEVTKTGLYCRQMNGLECSVTCFQNVLHNPPPIGSVITVKHSGIFTSGVLKRPLFWRERKDVEWSSIAEVDSTTTTTSEQSSSAVWTKSENHRLFFDTLAKKHDIQEPSDWYKIRRDDIYSQGGKKLLQQYYDNSVYKALCRIYPTVQLVPWKFVDGLPIKFWNKKENQRNYFDWLGNLLGFTQMEDWYKVTMDNITKNKGEGLVGFHYDGSPSKALKAIYHDHHWLPWKFDITPKGFWKLLENQRTFFNWMGTQIGVQQMDDWYQVTAEDIFKHGGCGLLTKYYSTSPSAALHTIYPDHPWELSRFGNSTYARIGYWGKKKWEWNKHNLRV